MYFNHYIFNVLFFYSYMCISILLHFYIFVTYNLCISQQNFIKIEHSTLHTVRQFVYILIHLTRILER